MPPTSTRSSRCGSTQRGVELANLAGESLEEVIAAAEGGIARIRTTHHLASSFLRYYGLCLWWANDHVTGRSEHPSG
jgi:hypothetical protein